MRPCRCPGCMSGQPPFVLLQRWTAKNWLLTDPHAAAEFTRCRQTGASPHLIGVSSARCKEVVLWDSEAQDDALSSIVELHASDRKGVLGRDDLFVRGIAPIGLAGLVPSLLSLGRRIHCRVLRLRPPWRHRDTSAPAYQLGSTSEPEYEHPISDMQGWCCSGNVESA